MYFQEVKPIKTNIATSFTINQGHFLVFASKHYLTMLFIGPSITPMVKQEQVWNLLPCNSTAEWLTIQQMSLNVQF